jgi:hypothetical protein
MLGLQAIPAPLLSLGLPKRLAVPEVADHLVCSVCGARNDELKRPIHARRPDCESSRGDWQISEMVIRLRNPARRVAAPEARKRGS